MERTVGAIFAPGVGGVTFRTVVSGMRHALVLCPRRPANLLAVPDGYPIANVPA
jgi:hypothetical protein